MESFVFFLHVILIASQAGLEKNFITTESAAFSFSVNCSINDTFSFQIMV